MSEKLDRLILERRILVTCGFGGVGKTSLSVAIALRAAKLGKRALVLTIDPAKRLADAMGVSRFGDQPLDLSKNCGMPPGSFSAVIPDPARTFEAFLRSLSDQEQMVAKIMKNPIFRIFSREHSGANEYLALERLHSLAKRPEYDLIVLDTPPSRSALSFLDAPQVLARFFDEKLIQLLLGTGSRVITLGVRQVLKLLESLTGSGFMTHLLDFAAALFQVRTRFLTKLGEVRALLQSPDVGLIWVTSPASSERQDEVDHFIRSAQDKKLQLDGFLINRALDGIHITSAERSDPELQEGIAVLEEIQRLQKEAFRHWQERQASGLLLLKAPELCRDIHSLEDLTHVAHAIEDLDFTV